VLSKMMSSAPRSTSFGRILDALACYFDICSYRTYDGEPAMKLEKHLERGRDRVKIEVERKGNVIMTVPMFAQLVSSTGSIDDRAHSFVKALIRGLVDVAVDEAKNRGLEVIGMTGGVSYNHSISMMAKELVETKGLKFACPDRLPNGDGCISTGQCAIALKRMK